MQTNQYHLGNAIVVTTTVPDGSWMATFPNFTGLGHDEGEALIDLASQLTDAATRIASLVPMPAGTATIERVAPEPAPRRNHVLIWARSEHAARTYFGASSDAEVTVIKDRPETDEEKAKYHADAKLFAIEAKTRTSGTEHATAGVRRSK